MTCRRWDRLLWGVQMRAAIAGDPPMLLGTVWHQLDRQLAYPEEPTRALLFRTRRAARDWCAEKNAHWRAANNDAFVRRWRVRPVRVRESVYVVEEGTQ